MALQKVITVAAGGAHNLATSGLILISPSNYRKILSYLLMIGVEAPNGVFVWSWGSGTYGQLG